MGKYWVLNKDGVVSNFIVWDGVSPYETGDDTLINCEEHPTVSFGWIFDGNNWIAPPEPEIEIVDLPSPPLENNNAS